MGALVDLTGRQIGYWTVLGRGRTEPLGLNGGGTRLFWRCRCVCGTERELVGSLLKRKNHAKSCGCKTSELISAAKVTHGEGGRGRRSGTYVSWAMMLNRCRNPVDPNYRYYGGRGIEVCERWLKFENFRADMGPRPPKMTVERNDVNGNYEPSNCCWATRKQQSQNRR